MLAVTISWVHVLGWWVAALLIAFVALFFGVLGVALSLVTRLRWWPVPAAACWVAVELAYSSFPFGGFGWTRLAYAGVDTPLNGWFPLVGVAGVSFLVALVGQVVAWLVLLVRERRPRVWTRAVPAVLVLAALGAAGVGLRSFQIEPLAGREGSVTVGVVQGNVPGRGIEALGRARTVTNNHLSESVDIMARARLGQTPVPDFLLWPENSTDIDPLLDPVTRATVAGAAAVAGLPILVGAVTQGPGPDERQTTALWWDPVRGPVATYHKRNLVPFGEWIPFRDELLPLVPILSQVGSQSIPGTEPGVLSVPLGGRTVKVGDVICFELAYDRTVHETMTNGAQVLDGAEQQRHVRRDRPDRAAVRHHPGPGDGGATRDRGRHHEQRLGLHRPRRTGGGAHLGVHAGRVRHDDAAALRPDPGRGARRLAGLGAEPARARVGPGGRPSPHRAPEWSAPGGRRCDSAPADPFPTREPIR